MRPTNLARYLVLTSNEVKKKLEPMFSPFKIQLKLGGNVRIIGLTHREFSIIPNKSQRLIKPWWMTTL
jgi:hypothetical protein